MDVRGRLIAVVVALALALAACGSRSDPAPSPVAVPPPATIDAAPAPPPPPGGALIVHVQDGDHGALAAIDLATRKLVRIAATRGTQYPKGVIGGKAALIEPDQGRPIVVERDGAGWRARPLGPALVGVASPKGDRIAGQCMPKRSNVCITAVAGGGKPRVVPSGFALPELNVWTPDDMIVVTDTEETGATVKLVDANQGTITEVGKTPSFDPLYTSPGGRTFAWIESSGGGLVLATSPRDAMARAKKIELGAGASAECAFAGDARVVCTIAGDDQAGPRRVVSIELASGAALELARDGFVTFPIASPDGRWVVYLAGDAASPHLAITPVDVADPAPLLPGATDTMTALTWLP